MQALIDGAVERVLALRATLHHENSEPHPLRDSGRNYVPKVSILTPTFRHAGFIGDCIGSVLAQTEPDWEMIIVDDGSDDGTPDIAESFSDPRIHVVRLEHHGVTGLGRVYATALARAISPIIAILEGDDKWPPTKIEIELPLFDDTSVVLAYGSAGLIDDNGWVYSRFWHSPRADVANNTPIGAILPSLVEVNYIVAATVMIRRSALDQIGGFHQPEGISYVDHPTWLRLATIGTFARSSRILGYWRRYSRQVTTQGWFADTPNRVPYLREIAQYAQPIVSAEVARKLDDSIRRDPPRQVEGATIARGRMALLAGKWREATRIFSSLLVSAEPKNRVLAVGGIFYSFIRRDMEHLISALGRHSLPSRRHSASHPQENHLPRQV